MIASSWSIKADGAQQDGGFGLFLTDRLWERTYTFSYPSEGLHTYVFRAQDLGHGGGGHNYMWFEVSGSVTVTLPAGACCFADGACAVESEADCSAAGGIYQGNETVCDPNPCPPPPPPAGACCFADGTCQVLTQDECTALGGIVWVIGEDCVGDCPPTATRILTWGRLKARFSG